MLRAVRPGEEIPQASIYEFLMEHNLINGSESITNIQQYATGYSNLTYLIQTGAHEYVLRRPPFGAIKRGHDMGREYKVLFGLNQGFTQAPKVFAYCEDPEIIGAPFYLMEKIEGIILNRKTAEHLDLPPQEFKAIASVWLDTFVSLHSLDYESLGLSDLGKPDGYVQRQVTNWGKQYYQAATEDLPIADHVIQWLQDHQPSQYDHRLIHNDYKYDNVAFVDQSWEQIGAILDWEMATLGDPLMDLGTSLAYWFIPTDHPMILKGWPSPTALPGNPGREDIVQQYTHKSGRSADHIVFYYTYGLCKVAVIVQQIYYRYAKGLTQDPRFANLNQATQLFLTMAKQVIQTQKLENLF